MRCQYDQAGAIISRLSDNNMINRELDGDKLWTRRAIVTQLRLSGGGLSRRGEGERQRQRQREMAGDDDTSLSHPSHAGILAETCRIVWQIEANLIAG